ncbi:MAG: ABC transporter substrate-binding protein [Rhodobacteraceae bacterium]|nr:ABC transporter substrate-binding protein [Paracoccaceae bacterium]
MNRTDCASCIRATLAATVLLAATGAGPAAAESQGITEDTIKIGNIVPYSGSASAYGNIGEALKACFAMFNEKGGVHGRKIDFISLDDGYSPPKTVEQARRLVERDKVAAIVDVLGTPTNNAIHDYMNRKKIPQLFVISGAAKWGQPEKYPWTMGWQPTNSAEAHVYARYILDTLPEAKIGILYQNDDYGKEWLEEFRDGLGDRADALILAEEPYETSDPSVDSQIVKLAASGADVFVNISLSKFATQSIRKANEIGWKPLQFLNSVSASVGSILEPAGLERSTGIITAQYLKDATDPQFADDAERKEWEAWMDKYYPSGDKTNSFNVFAYAGCHTMMHVLQEAGENPTQESIMTAAGNMKDVAIPMLLPGVTITTGPDDFYPIETLQLVRFNGTFFEKYSDAIDVGKP